MWSCEPQLLSFQIQSFITWLFPETPPERLFPGWLGPGLTTTDGWIPTVWVDLAHSISK